jgi:uncharacterized membrane protein
LLAAEAEATTMRVELYADQRDELLFLHVAERSQRSVLADRERQAGRMLTAALASVKERELELRTILSTAEAAERTAVLTHSAPSAGRLFLVFRH